MNRVENWIEILFLQNIYQFSMNNQYDQRACAIYYDTKMYGKGSLTFLRVNKIMTFRLDNLKLFTQDNDRTSLGYETSHLLWSLVYLNQYVQIFL